MKPNKLAATLSALLLSGLAWFEPADAAPVTSHPRLWFTQADIPRLQSWATPSNPMYAKGLLPAVQFAVNAYDTKFFPGGQPNPNWTTQVDTGGVTGSLYPAESYAELFAFMSLVDPDPNARILHAQRARNLLMYVIDQASQGHSSEQPYQGLPYRDVLFASYDRSRWWGEGFGLTVDWIYDTVDAQGNKILSAADKAKIQKTFLIWANDNVHGYMAPPPGINNNSQLLQGGARGAANNYFSGHMRNLTMMTLAMDPADDPPVDPNKPITQFGNTLRSYLDNVLGEWLYEQYALYEQPEIVRQAYNLPASWLPKLGSASGGLSAEGLEYGDSLGFVQEAMLALYTAGYEDTALAGPQAGLIGSGYWDRFGQGILHSMPPAPTILHTWQGPVYQPGGYGDTDKLYIYSSLSPAFAALGVHDQLAGNPQRLEQSRWIVANAVDGGVGRLFSRASNIWSAGSSTVILHYMLFDPAAASDVAALPSPRPGLPTEFYDPALGRQLVRTDWTPNASFYGFKCSWIAVNHQNADCNQFELYRGGEWLTKEHSNYDVILRGQTTDYHNTMSIENERPADLIVGSEENILARGSQWMNGRAAGDPTVVASTGSGYAYAQGDSTNLYNHKYQWGKGALDIAHASRSIVWLKPDFIVVYDRAVSKTEGRFKRFNLQLVSNPAVLGHLAVDTLPSGQQLFIQNLLPANATLTGLPDEPIAHVADGETTQFRLVVEDTSNPSDVRFLHVLQGADANQAMQPAAHVQSSDGRYEGAVVNDTAVLFQSSLGPSAPAVSYVVPQEVEAHVISGLTPNSGYDLQTQADPNGVLVTVSEGGTFMADAAGVLSVNPGSLLTGLTPAAMTLSSAGGASSVSVSALAGAAWNAASNAGWISLTSNTAGTGDGVVGFTVDPNTTTSQRSGTISIGGLTFTLTQKGMVCQPALSSTSASVPATVASGNVNVTVAPGCAWNAASNVAWVSVSNSGGTGNGSVNYTVQANTGAARSGTLSIAGQTFTVSQAGVSSGGTGTTCSVSLNIARKLMIAGASSKGVVLTAPAGCAWTATSSDPSWLTVSPTSGSGNKVVNFAATANSATTSRSANLTIGGKTLNVVQAGNVGNGCMYAFGSDAQPVFADHATALHGGGTGSVPVSAPGGCAWTSTSNVPWITVTAGASVASGGSTVKYSVAANPGGVRSGTLTIAGMTYTVTQE